FRLAGDSRNEHPRNGISVMANYTVKDIQALRERTGAGMMDVKKALDEADGDDDTSMEIIRVKGLQGASKREGRAAAEGLIAATVKDCVGIMSEVSSQTDIVPKSDKIIETNNTVVNVAVSSGVDNVDALLAADYNGNPLSEYVKEEGALLGEKVEVRRLARLEGAYVDPYLHRTSADLPAQV